MGRIDGSRAAVWFRRLARFRGSDLTVVEFCRREGVSQPSFYQWRKRLEAEEVSRERQGRKRMASAGDLSPFVPVNVTSPVMAEVEFPNGVRVRIPAAHIDALRAAIRAGNDLCQEGPAC